MTILSELVQRNYALSNTAKAPSLEPSNSLLRGSNRWKLRNLLAAGIAVAIFTATVSQAQEVEEVIIQATQTEDAALDDLVSAAVLDAEKLADAGIENVEDVAAYVPNLVLSETDTGTNIVIRGIGAGVNQGFDQSVGLFIDGVPLPRGQMARAPFLDLAGVQVLRGPQYVKDGNYSIAGSVHLLTKVAENEFEAQFATEYTPSQNDRKILLTAGMPLAEWASVRFAFQRQKSDGYIENVFRNESGPQKDELLFRSVFAFLPTDNLSIKLKVETGSFDTKGRQIEILDSQPTPDYRLFPEVIANGGRSTGSVDPGSGIATAWRNEIDYAFQPARTLYDWSLLGNPGTPYFSGRSYLQVISDLYTDTAPYGQQINFGGSSFSTTNPAIGPQAAPAGILDSKIDFKRAADAAEKGENDTINFTTNVNYWLGEHELALVASYINYEVNELIDSDFTAVSALETIQSEEFTQRFYKFDYHSPKGNFIEWDFGLMFSDTELEFIEDFTINTAGAQNQAEADELLRQKTLAGDIAFLADNIAFNPDTPMRAYFGRLFTPYVRALQLYVPSRIFTQEAQTSAAYFNSKLHFTDSFRANLGFRYTHSEKEATRDFALLLRDGSVYDIPNDTFTRGAEFNATVAFGAIFNFQEHTNRKPFDPQRSLPILPALGGDPNNPGEGNRREEIILPSLTLEWDVNNDISLRMAVRKANKLGGFDARSVSTPKTVAGFNVQPGTFEFEDEDATSYELGGLWYLPNGFGQLNGTIFYTDFKNLQVSAADKAVGFNVRNAGAASTFGVELEGLLELTDRFNINYSVAWIDFSFTDYDLGNCYLGERADNYLITSPELNIPLTFPIGTILPIVYEEALTTPYQQTPFVAGPRGFGSIPLSTPASPDANGGDFANIQRFDYKNVFSASFCDYEGRTNQYVAEWQGTFSFNYTTEINQIGFLSPTLDVLYNSGYHTSTNQDPDVAQDRYVQLNGRLGLASTEETWVVALNVENITNEKIVLFSNELPVATRIQGSKSYYGFVRPPRSVSVSFKYNFF